ncbi:MAG: acylphosphatase [Planctomycetes bacterium]|nr:acylphosphatase [Planctomycetota bacterium]
MSEPIRRRILYSGRVQGVGFRHTTCMLSRDCAVTGFVRNLPDGRVEAVVEGDPAEIDRLQSSIAGELGGFIRDTSTETAKATGEFSGFAIRY